MMNVTHLSASAIVATALAAIGLATGGAAQAAGDVETGERLAVRWCAGCHLVKADQPQANADVPAFLAIARMPAFDPEKTASFLMNPHPKMPSYPLSRSEAEDIASYIGSLAK